MAKQRNELLNIMEAIAAFLVILIHFEFPGETGDAVTAVARISVPFFFSISGYFYFKNDIGREMASIPRKIRRLLMLILCSECAYFLFYWVLQIDNHGFTIQALRNVVILQMLDPYRAELVNLLAVFAPPLNGTFWFVTSLTVVYICVYFVSKYGKLRTAFVISLVCLFAGFTLRRILFHAGINTEFPLERLLPVLPFPFFMIGYYIRKHQNWFDQISVKAYCAVFTVGLLLTLLEQYGGRRHILYAGTLMMVPTLLAFAGKHRNFVVKSAAGRYLSHIGSDTATYIYMLHVMVGNICSVLVPRLLSIDAEQKLYMWLFPVLVCIASVGCGEIIYGIKRFAFKRQQRTFFVL